MAEKNGVALRVLREILPRMIASEKVSCCETEKFSRRKNTVARYLRDDGFLHIYRQLHVESNVSEFQKLRHQVLRVLRYPLAHKIS